MRSAISDMGREELSHDVFLSHASEDKASVAHPLADLLEGRGLRVWLDDQRLNLGDSVHVRVERALRSSRFAVVVLSPTYLAKKWTMRELEALLEREEGLEKVVLPVLHGITHHELRKRDLILASRAVANTSDGLDRVADRIEAAIATPSPSARQIPGLDRARGGSIDWRRPARWITLAVVSMSIAGGAYVGSSNGTVPLTTEWQSWKYDLFVCEESSADARNVAEQMKHLLVAAGAKRTQIKDLQWPAAKGTVKYVDSGYEIRGEPDEAAALRAVAALLQSTVRDPIRRREITPATPTPGYLSLFLCPDVDHRPDPGVTPGRIVG